MLLFYYRLVVFTRCEIGLLSCVLIPLCNIKRALFPTCTYREEMSAEPIMIKGNRHQKFPSCLFTAAKVNTICFAPIISYFHQQEKKPLKQFSFSHQSIVKTDRWERLNVFLMTFGVFFCTRAKR